MGNNFFHFISSFLPLLLFLYIIFIPVLIIMFVFAHKKIYDTNDRFGSSIDKFTLELKRFNNKKNNDDQTNNLG